jgi:Glycosyl transferases group 1
LLADWKKNINDLFVEDKEVITYKSDSECVEKAKWFMSNRQKCLEISIAG